MLPSPQSQSLRLLAPAYPLFEQVRGDYYELWVVAPTPNPSASLSPAPPNRSPTTRPFAPPCLNHNPA